MGLVGNERIRSGLRNEFLSDVGMSGRKVSQDPVLRSRPFSDRRSSLCIHMLGPAILRIAFAEIVKTAKILGLSSGGCSQRISLRSRLPSVEILKWDQLLDASLRDSHIR